MLTRGEEGMEREGEGEEGGERERERRCSRTVVFYIGLNGFEGYLKGVQGCTSEFCI